MEQSNVNNLNGVPNFGHGHPEVAEQIVEPKVEVVQATEEVEVINQEQE